MVPEKSLSTATAVSFSPSGASSRNRSIDGREQERRVGKELLSIFAREDRGRAGDRHDQVRLGTVDEEWSGCSRRSLVLARRQTLSGPPRPARRSRAP